MKIKSFKFLLPVLFLLIGGLPGANAATIALVKTIGTAAVTAGGTNISITVPAGGVAAGNSIILTLAIGDVGTAYTATDSRGNAYSLDIQGVQSSHVWTVVLSAHNVAALSAGDTITISHPPAAKRALVATEFAGLARTNAFDKANANGNNGNLADSNPTAATAQAAELLIGSIAVGGPVTNGFTAGDDGQGGGFSLLARAGTTGGSDFTINAEFEIVNAVNAYRARGTLSPIQKWAAAIATYKAAPACLGDTNPPAIACPPDLFTNTAAATCARVIHFAAPAVTDNCGVASITFSPASGTAFPLGTNRVTITATDPAGNSNSCSFNVTVTDTTPPALNCASNKFVECDQSWSFDKPTAIDVCCGTNVTVTILGTVTNSGGCSAQFTRTWQATDCASNSTTCSQTVTVADTAPPVLTCASNKTVECDTTWSFDRPTAVDVCCGTNVTITELETLISDNPCHKTLTRTWQVTDCCSNSITCSQTVTITDTTPPVLTCSSNKTVECGAPWSFDRPSADDVCSGTNVTITVINTVTNGIPCQYAVTRTWRATDACSNSVICSQTVTIADTTPPVITCSSNKTVAFGAPWSFDKPTAVDACCGTNVTITVTSTVTNGLGCQSITRTWQATDCCSNSSTCSQTVNVADTTPPVLVCSLAKTVECGQAWSFDAPTALDAICGTNVTVIVVNTVTNGNSCPLQITRVWNATDCCGNGSTCSQTVTVRDVTPPVITCASNKTVECGQPWSFNKPTALDACYGTNVTITTLETVTNGNACELVLTRTWEAADACSNKATCSQTVTVKDTAPPVVTCASNKTVACGSALSYDPPTAVDACCGTNVTIFTLSTITNGTNPLTLTRTWQVTDCCGNATACAQTLTVAAPASAVLTPSVNAGVVHLVFATVNGPTYIVERTDIILPAAWTNVASVPGDGLSHDVVDSESLPTARFYRLRIVCP